MAGEEARSQKERRLIPMLTHAFTCTGPYAVLVMLGIKRTENRGTRPGAERGRCAVSCSKSFCKEEYGEFVRWAARALGEEDFARLPSWGDVKDWPGKVVGCCDYEVKSKNEKGKSTEWDEGLAYWWDLSEVVCFDGPIACRGNVGMWEMPRELSAQVSAADALARSVGERVASAEDAARLFRLAMPIAGGNEGFFVLPLDAERKPLAAPILVSMGTEANTTAVSIGDVFREAFKVGAEAIIVAHNHPGGTLKASPDDMMLTNELSKAADLLGVKLLDHLIVTKDGFARVGEARDVPLCHHRPDLYGRKK